MFKFTLSLLLCFVILAVASNWYLETQTKQVVIDRVLKTERINTTDSDGHSQSKYMIYGESEVYQDTDSLWNQKFNSADLYAHIEQGKMYKFTVYGYRIPFLSKFRNIVSYQEVES